MPRRNAPGTGAVAFLVLASAVAQQPQCPRDVTGLAFKMLKSNIARRDGMESADEVSGLIELGIFHQALRESIYFTESTEQKQEWSAYLCNSTRSATDALDTASEDAELPLDRLSVGTSLIHQRRHGARGDAETIAALKQSVRLQPRNDDGSLWYYDNVANVDSYRNLSYLDGMYSYPTFAILAANHTSMDINFGPSAALEQIEILYSRCKDGFGLVRHGFDASKSHKWAESTSGCSPVVWGRALAWYTMGILESLEVLESVTASKRSHDRLRKLFVKLIRAQFRASKRSLQTSGNYGVWQIVDHPAATFGGYSNYIEASASLMTAYSFLKGVRLGLIQDEELAHGVKLAGLGIYQGVQRDFLIRNQNDTFSLNGTSSVASLSGDVDFTYYVTRPTLLNNLKGTSAFILASLEVEKIC